MVDVFRRFRVRSEAYFFFKARPWLDWLLISVLCVLFRFPEFSISVIDWDESLYALVAWDLVNERAPYTTFFATKPVGIFVFLAASMAVFGDNIFSLRFVGLTAIVATCLLLHAAARAAGLSRLTALGAAILYASFSTYFGGLATNIEIVFAPFLVASYAIALRSLQNRSREFTIRIACILGLLVGFAGWLKYNAVLPGYCIAGFVIISWHIRPFRLKRIVMDGFVFFISTLMPSVFTILYYIWIGRLKEFWYSNFGFMAMYAQLNDPSGPPTLRPVIDVLLPLIFILPLLIRGGRLLAQQPRWTALTLTWLLGAIAAIAAPWKFYDHYFLLLLPPLCFLAAMGIEAVLRSGHFTPRSAVISLIFLIVACIPSIIDTPRRFEAQAPDVPTVIADALRAADARDGQLWVVNGEPIIYFLAKVRPPTRFVMPPELLTAFSALTLNDPDKEISRILEERPRFLVTATSNWVGAARERKAKIESVIDSEYQMIMGVPHKKGTLMLFQHRS